MQTHSLFLSLRTSKLVTFSLLFSLLLLLLLCLLACEFGAQGKFTPGAGCIVVLVVVGIERIAS